MSRQHKHATALEQKWPQDAEDGEQETMHTQGNLTVQWLISLIIYYKVTRHHEYHYYT